MKKRKICGFDYYIDKEMLDDYSKKPYHLRLKWLYMGNLFRKGYDKKVIEIQDKQFRCK